MKRIITLFVLLTTTFLYSQSSGITYQAVLYNPSGEILPGNNNANAVLSNKDICLRFSITDAQTSLEYQETQKVKTDEFGMVNLLVGSGSQVGGYATNFSAIVWNSSSKKLQVEIDVTGTCANFIEVSKQDFSAVPFAYASKTAENVTGIVPITNGGTGSSTVSGAKTNLGLNNVDNTSDLNKPISLATQAALDAKAPLASPALTGVPTAPTAATGTSSTQIATTAFVNAALSSIAAPDATTTLKGRIQLAGDLAGTADAPTVPGLATKENVTNKSTDIVADANSITKYPSVKLIKDYVDGLTSSGIADADSTTKGKLQLAGDLAGVGSSASSPMISNAAITTVKLADASVTNAKIGEIVSVNKGGTGATSLTGYLKGNGTSAFTTVSSIPVADVTGAVSSVNGVTPVNGNVSVLLGRVFSGATEDPSQAAAVIAINNDGDSTNNTKESDIYIVAGHVNNANNGRTFIFNGTTWLEVATNLASTDSRYVNITGDIMEGNLTIPTGKNVIITDAPTNATDAANKAYVDTKADVSSGSGTINFVSKFSAAKTLSNSSIFDNGNVGIGTTNPNSKFEVNSNVSETARFITSLTTTNFATIGIGNGSGTWARVAAGDSKFQIRNYTTDATVLHADLSTGNVGIGTTAPANKLDVVGGINLRNTVGGWGTGYGIELNTNSNAPRIDWVFNGGYVGQFASDANDFQLRNSKLATGGFRFFTNPSGSQVERMAILNNGNIGIGTSSPSGTLEVATSNGLSSIIKRFGNTNLAAANLILQKTYGATATTHGAGIANGDYVGRILFSASNGTDYGTNNGTDIVGYAAGIQSTSNNGGGIFFRTVPIGSVAQSVERMRISESGNIGIGTSSPSKFLDVVNASSTYGGVIEAEGPVSSTFTRAISIRMREGTSAAPIAIKSGDISAFAFAGYDGASFSSAAAGMSGIATQDWTTTNKGMALGLYSSTNGTTAVTERMRIDHNGNVGIGTSSPNASAILDATAINKGFLPPRVSLTGTADVSTIATPATGLLVYNTSTAGTSPATVQPGYYYYNGSRWVSLAIPGGANVNVQNGAYTLTENDSKGVVIINSVGNVTITVPINLPTGFFCQIIQKGAGIVTVSGATGVTINSANGLSTRAQYSSIGLMMESSTIGYVSGDSGL